VPSIRILPPEVVSRIAAGEIVERPSSVLKELIENSIDSGATEVLIELEDGGKRLIRIRDNGSGIEPEDLPLAFERHATSKLTDEHVAGGLFGIGTLGFRGEALASVASVADVEVLTRTHKAPHGYRYRPGGSPSPAAVPDTGTTIEVRSLFHNVPARRKFLRSSSTELSHALDAVTRLALGFPGIRFRAGHEGKSAFDFKAARDLGERLEQILGKDAAALLLPLATGSAPPCVSGFVGNPRLSRKDGRGQSFFVNGRWVRDRVLSHALRSAYQGYQTPGSQPVAYLFIDVPEDEVDVNVHPAKVEVRFRESSQVYSLVQRSVRDALDAGAERGQEPLAGAPLESAAPGMRSASAAAGAPPDALAAIRAAALEFLRSPERAPAPRMRGNGGIARASASPSEPFFAESAPPVSPPSAVPGPRRVLPAFQILDSYIVLESPEGLVLIDQHAFHEKIIFEEVVRRMQEGRVESQRLLLPEVVDVPPSWMPISGEVARALAPFGFEIEPFGETAVAIHAFPGVLDRETGGTDLGAIVRAAFESALEHGGKVLEEPGGEAPGALGAAVRRLAATIACKRAVKAGQRLREDEIQSLIARGELAEDPRHCPHGRPAAVFLTRRDLEKQFDRR